MSADPADPFADPTAGPAQLANRLAKVQKERRRWAPSFGATCWRIYEKDLPDQPLIVDWYDGVAVVWLLDRTRNETEADEDRWAGEVLAAVQRGLKLSSDQVFVKRRRRQKDRQEGGQYQRTGDAGVERIVTEADLRFVVNCSDYLDTGLFLDHRPLRARVRADARDRRVLNLFAYTGSFTVHARAGGARSTTTVDLSNTYLAWAERNLALNGFAPDDRHTIVRADCLRWLTEAKPAAYDLIVCDPPAFSNSTAMRDSFAVDRDHGRLLAACRRLLAPGGTLWFSCNLRGFALTSPPPGLAVEDCSAWTVPADFRNRKIHQCWRLTAP
jgi:23S rRNA (cytosine1962-C5)-methyltransferase